MQSELYKLVYCSRNLITGTAGSQDVEIGQILRSARDNNSRQNVTGALLFNSGCFAQVLEGPRTSIERIFEQIQRDPRHGDVTVLESGSTEQREFPDWAMAHVQPPTEAQAQGLASTLQIAMLNPTAAGTQVLDLLKSLVIQED